MEARGPAAAARIHEDVARYYGERIARYGPTPAGVDWSCAPTQERRFAQLLRICDFTRDFSLNDVGCGYGALARYLARCAPGCSIRYLGLDLSPAMIASARRLAPHDPLVAFDLTRGNHPPCDYAVASGIFNVKLGHSMQEWEEWVAWTLERMARASRLGFAVNFVSPSDGLAPQLYAPPPGRWAAFCEALRESTVEVADDYGLDEFTLLVRARNAGTPSGGNAVLREQSPVDGRSR